MFRTDGHSAIREVGNRRENFVSKVMPQSYVSDHRFPSTQIYLRLTALWARIHRGKQLNRVGAGADFNVLELTTSKLISSILEHLFTYL